MATLILRPNAAGDSTQLTPSAGANYECVDEESADGDTSYVTHGVESGAATFKIAIKENGVTSYGDLETVGTTYTSYSKTWATRPSDAGTWTWGDIDGLQIGVWTTEGPRLDLYNLPAHSGSGTINSITVYSLAAKRTVGFYYRCTQVYVEVDYTAAGGGGSAIFDAAAAGVI